MALLKMKQVVISNLKFNIIQGFYIASKTEDISD